MKPLRIVLQPGREKPVLDGHPWVFSGAIARQEGNAAAPVAEVVSASGRFLGVGFHSPRSQIRVRLPGLGLERLDRAFFAARLAEAAALRQAVVPAETTGYRLLNAEGDGLPGWTVDRFGDVLVSQISVAGLEALRDEAYAALAEAYPHCAVLQLNRLPARKLEGLPQDEDEVIAGTVPAEVSFLEHGLELSAELAGGQKTGFYCDQRENRRRVGELAKGREVLDLFAHSGAFGLQALRGGARRVSCVESSPRLVERGIAQLEHNRQAGRLPEETALEWQRADVFQHLREPGPSYDLVVCDPPPLVRRRNALDAGARAYKDLNRLALGRLRPGGLLFTFSCSGAVDSRLFRQVLFAAAVEAGVRVALLEPLAAAPDHPVSLLHPQGEYLKGWLALVQGPLLQGAL